MQKSPEKSSENTTSVQTVDAEIYIIIYICYGKRTIFITLIAKKQKFCIGNGTTPIPPPPPVLKNGIKNGYFYFCNVI